MSTTVKAPEAAKKRLLDVTLKVGVPTFAEGLQLSQAKVDQITKKIIAFGKTEEDPSALINKVLDTFTEPHELVCALVTLQADVQEARFEGIVGGDDASNLLSELESADDDDEL